MATRQWRRITPDQRREIYRMAANGASYAEIARHFGRWEGSMRAILRPLGGVVRRELWQVSSSRLSVEDRVEIRLGIERGESFECIGARIGRHRSTVCREVNNNGGRSAYRPTVAHHAAWQRARRPKVTKLASNPELCTRVIADLEALWSPQQIAARLRAQFGQASAMSVSHETIYKSLYVQGRGELRRELARCLRSGRAKRRPQGRLEARGHIPDMVTISERPPEVADRALPGHWEGDLIIGKNNNSAIGTLVERSTRFVMLLYLGKDRSAEAVRVAMTEAIGTLPAALRRSITWDRGKEMAQHVRFSVDTGVAVYFCDPHSPWQRGSNENTNGLLRQYFPKGTNLAVHGPDVLQAAADSLNGRPRQTLGWMTPSEKLAELVATTG
jgi:IS30 family transposase